MAGRFAIRREPIAALVGLLALTGVFSVAADAGAASRGTLMWCRRYDGPASSDDVAYSIAVAPDGARAFVTGSSEGFPVASPSIASDDYATVAYDAATGARLWVRRYDGPVHGTDQAVDIAVSPDGSAVFVTGFSEARGGPGWATIAYDSATGATLWSRRHHGGAAALAVSPDGATVLVVGSAPSTNDTSDYATLAYDARTGATIWARRYDGPAGLDDAASAVFATAGTVFVTGSSFGSDATWGDYATIAYDSTDGSRRWVRRLDGPGHGYDFAHAVVGSTDASRVFVTGESANRLGSDSDFATIAYDGITGERLWTRRYGTHLVSYALDADATGNGSVVFVTGSLFRAASAGDFGTIAYDGATGARIWAKRYSSPGVWNDTALAIMVNAAATSVYVTGLSHRGSTGEDVTTFAYDASTGSRVWSRFFSSADAQTDVGRALDVSPDGAAVYVGGSVSSSSADYITLAYVG